MIKSKMKRHLSVLMLFTRSTLYKFLLIILAMAAVQGCFFTLAFRNARSAMERGHFIGLDEILAGCHFIDICSICFILLCIALCLTGCEFGSRQGYTLSRLRVSRRAVIFWQIVNNLGYLVLFLAAQIGIVLLLCGFYVTQYKQPQVIMLVFYKNNFLHNLLPLAEWSRFVYNIVLLIAVAAASACFPVRLRDGKKPYAIFVAIVFCIQSFSVGIGALGYNIVCTFFLALVTFLAVNGVWKETDDEAFS